MRCIERVMGEARYSAARLVCDAGATIGESPAWLGDRVRWTDPVSRRLLGVAPDGSPESFAMSASVWSLATLADTTLIGSLDDRLCAIDGSARIQAGPAAAVDQGCRFNDMTAGPQGGLWVGMMHRAVLATHGAIFHARSLQDPPRRVAHGLGVPNGMKLSADGGTLFVVDTLERTLLAYPVDDDSLREPVIVSDFMGLPGKPDGMTIASDGTFWVAMWGGSSVVQLSCEGAFLRSISLPAPHVSSLCFATPDRLLVTTSRMRLSSQALLQTPASGGLFEVLLEAA
jgi:sugar lactone lactonase YvrE